MLWTVAEACPKRPAKAGSNLAPRAAPWVPLLDNQNPPPIGLPERALVRRVQLPLDRCIAVEKVDLIRFAIGRSTRCAHCRADDCKRHWRFLVESAR
jgi:hypothetical protein